jgi:molybdate transport system substrate-binding protein
MRPLLLLLLLAVVPSGHAREPLRVAVAANFRPTLERISARFEARTGHRVLISSASTGALYNQILYGAPFDLFFAADRDRPRRLAERGLGTSECYALGRLVLVGGQGDLAALADPDLSLAIANPDTAPYGTAAMEVLARPEFAGGRGRRLVRGNNVAQAYQFWQSGGTALALVARGLAPGGAVIPADWHRPLEQHLLVLDRGAGREATQAYVEWTRSDTVRSLITDAGYDYCP